MLKLLELEKTLFRSTKKYCILFTISSIMFLGVTIAPRKNKI